LKGGKVGREREEERRGERRGRERGGERERRGKGEKEVVKSL
jgi:hypothetical protein